MVIQNENYGFPLDFHGHSSWIFKMTRNQRNENGIQLDGNGNSDVCIKYGGCPKGRKVIPAASGPPHRLGLHCLGETHLRQCSLASKGSKTQGLQRCVSCVSR